MGEGSLEEIDGLETHALLFVIHIVIVFHGQLLKSD